MWVNATWIKLMNFINRRAATDATTISAATTTTTIVDKSTPNKAHDL